MNKRRIPVEVQTKIRDEIQPVPHSAIHFSVTRKVIDFADRSDSIWFRNHVIWAMENNHEIHVVSAR